MDRNAAAGGTATVIRTTRRLEMGPRYVVAAIERGVEVDGQMKRSVDRWMLLHGRHWTRAAALRHARLFKRIAWGQSRTIYHMQVRRLP